MAATTVSTEPSPYRIFNCLWPQFKRLSTVSRVDSLHDTWCDSNSVDEVLKHHHELHVEITDTDQRFWRLLREAQEWYPLTIQRAGVYVIDPNGRRIKVSDQSEEFSTTVTRYRIITE